MTELLDVDNADNLHVRKTGESQIVSIRLGFALMLITCMLSFDVARCRETRPEDVASLVEKSVDSHPSIDVREFNTARRIQALGPQAIPHLLPLLRRYENPEVRELTSYTLRDMGGLTEEHLDALIESRRHGDAYIPSAIARVGTPRAILFLIEDLKRVKQGDTELVTAFEILGERAVPYLFDLVRAGPMDGRLQTGVADIFGWLGNDAESAVTPLTEFVSANQVNENTIRCAVLTLGAIGPRARGAGPVLKQLAKEGPQSLVRIADQALLAIEVSDAVQELLRGLGESPDDRDFLKIASLGENGKGAGPALARYLRRGDQFWFTRAYAAKTLGYIGYVEASPDLIEALRSEDWQLVYVSVKSLGRLHAADALGPLSEIADSYWHPAVHEAAVMAVRVIRGEASYEPNGDLGREFWDHVLVAKSGYHDPNGVARPGSNRFYALEADQLSSGQLKKLTCHVAVKITIPGNAHRFEETRTVTCEGIPDVGIKIDDGYLVGCDRGEFVGALVCVDSEGRQTMVLHQNVLGIHNTTSGILAVTGYEHMMPGHGEVYKISRGGDGVWQAVSWKKLPGHPIASGVRPSGNLFVACREGKVEITPAGDVLTVGQ